MSQHTTSSPTLSASPTFVVISLDHQQPSTKKPDLKLHIAPYSSWTVPSEVDNKRMMTGKGFIEPHRNNLPRRKRRVITAPVDTAAAAATPPVAMVPGIDKSFSQAVLPTSEAGPRFSAEESDSENHLHDDTGLSSLLLQNSSVPSNPQTTSLLTFQTPKRALFHTRLLDDDASSVLQSPPPKGHLQPTAATLPRRHRSLVLREQERRRRLPIAEQQTPKPDNTSEKADSHFKDSQTRTETDIDSEPVLVAVNSESQSMRRRHSMCAQELSEGIILGFLPEGDENVVRIKVYDDSTTSSPSSPSSTPIPTSSSEIHLELPMPTNPLSYTDGTTSLSDSQIQQACAFIDEHISVVRRISVLILTPRTRPEEAMSISISYLAGVEKIDMNKGAAEGDKGNTTSSDQSLTSDNHDSDDHTYSTVHRLLMAFHDDSGSLIPPNGAVKLMTSEVEQHDGIDTDSRSRGLLRPEWRGILSFDGMQRLDGVWSLSSNRSC